MLRGQLTAAEQLALLSSHEDLADALEGAFFVQVTLFRSPLHCNVSFCLSRMLMLEICAPSIDQCSFLIWSIPISKVKGPWRRLN